MSNTDRIITAARAAVGLCGCDPGPFAAWLGPIETPEGKRATWPLSKPYGKGGLSLCALTTERIWHHAGLAVPASWSPYRGGTFARTHSWARSVGALGDLRHLPGVGCAWWTASHFVACIESWDDPWDITLPYQDCTTIEGGQVCPDSGLQTIARRRRRYWPGQRPRVAGIRKDGTLEQASYVLGWIEVEALPVVG